MGKQTGIERSHACNKQLCTNGIFWIHGLRNLYYKHMIPRQLTYITRNLSYVTGKFINLVEWWFWIVVFIDVGWLRRSHLLRVFCLVWLRFSWEWMFRRRIFLGGVYECLHVGWTMCKEGLPFGFQFALHKCKVGDRMRFFLSNWS